MMNLRPQQPGLTSYFGRKNWLTETEMEEAAAAMNLPTDRNTLKRIARANAILFHSLVKSTALHYLYKVQSQFHPDKTYLVIQQEGGYYQCTCPDYTKRQLPCKHAIAVQAYNSLVDLAYQEEVVEAYDPQGGYYRFLKLIPTTNQIPMVEVADV